MGALAVTYRRCEKAPVMPRIAAFLLASLRGMQVTEFIHLSTDDCGVGDSVGDSVGDRKNIQNELISYLLTTNFPIDSLPEEHLILYI